MVGDFLPCVWRKLGGGYPQGVKIKKEGEGYKMILPTLRPAIHANGIRLFAVCVCQWIDALCPAIGMRLFAVGLLVCLPFMRNRYQRTQCHYIEYLPTVCNGIGPRLQCLNDCQRIDGGLCLNGFISIHVEILPNALSIFADTNEGMNCQRCEILCRWCVKYLLSVCRCVSAIGLNVKEGLNVGLSVIGLSAIHSRAKGLEILPTIELLTCDCTASIYV